MQHELVNLGCLHNLCCCRQPGTSCPVSSSVSCFHCWRQASAAVEPILELQLLGTSTLPLFSLCKNINLRWIHQGLSFVSNEFYNQVVINHWTPTFC